ncbi:MAG: hypothetical protein UW34_C0007G0006 [Parcubacteria group bacterium GW2011_GWA2_44_15]|nr:MAG: hypothetical protein UW34_C0007G0006 [Parcubacteria group bacterium GW2011_GWA2_44_15]
MDIFQKNKKVFLFIGIFIIVALVYKFFFSDGAISSKNSIPNLSENGSLSELSISPADAIVGRELLLMLAELQSISLDASIFTNPVYVSLKDWSRPIESQPFGKAFGRRNPFSDFVSGTTTALKKDTSLNLSGGAFGFDDEAID